MSWAAVSGTSLTIGFNKGLAAASGLTNNAFTVKKSVSGSEQTETLTGSPSISGRTVTLTLASAVVSTDTDVKVSYTKPSTGSNNKLKSLAGTEVENFTDQSVSNKAAEAPDVRQVLVTSTPRSGTTPKKYGAGEKIQVTVTFDEAVTVTGDPEFEIKLGNQGQAVAKRAAYISGSGTTALVFEYTVQSADRDDNGIWIEADALKLDGDDLIRDGGNNNADVTHTAPGGRRDHKVDGSLTPPATNTAPTASNNTVETKEDAAYTFAASDFNFSDTDVGDALEKVKIVAVETAGDLELDGTDVTANQEVTKANLDDGKLIFTPAADANGASYATFTFKVNDGDDDSADTYTMTIDVDPAPDVTQVAVTSTPRSGTTPKKYGAGEKIKVTVTFDEAVTVTGDPLVQVVVGSNTRNADYASGSGSTALIFEYTVVAADTDSDGIAVNADVKLDTDSGSEDHVRDGDSNDADVTFTALAAQSAHKVDGSLTPPADTTAPTVSAAEVTAAKPKELVITFSQLLATGSVPAASAFAVKVGGSAGPGVSSVAIDSGDATKVKLGLAVALDAGQTSVTVDYTKPGSNPLKDGDDNEVATFTGRSVTNNAPACPTGQPADAFWTACLTIGKISFGGQTFYGYLLNRGGAFSDTGFTYKGQNIEVIQVSSTGSIFTLGVNRDIPGTERLVLQVGATSLASFGTRQGTNWGIPPAPAPVWTDANIGDKVSVSLREYVAPENDPNNEYVITGVPILDSGGHNPDQRITAYEEGTPKTFRVRMKNPLSRAVTATVRSWDAGAVSATPGELTFTPENWNTDQTVTVQGLDDDDGLDEWVYVEIEGSGIALDKVVKINVIDNDTHMQTGHSLIYNKSGNWMRVQQGGNAKTFTVRLRFQPEGTTTLNWDPLVVGPVKADGNGIKVFKIPPEGIVNNNPPDKGVKISPKYRTFTRDNWATPQEFTVTADAGIAGGTIIPLRPYWRQSQYPYTKSPEFAIEVVTSLGTALPGPAALSAAAGDGAVRLAWTTPEDGEDITGWQARYGEIDTRNGAVDWGRWYTVPGAEPDAGAHTVTGLTNGTSYAFQVRAAVGHLKASPSVQQIAMPMAGMTLDAPGRPDLFVDSGNAAATLSWNALRYGGTITGWQYRYGLLDGPTNTVDWGEWTDIAGATAQTRSHTVTGLVNDTEYGIQLRAVAGDKAGDMSERQVAWPFHPPFDAVEFTEVTSTTVAIGWVLPEGGDATGLRAMRRLVGGEWEEAAELALDATSYTYTGLTPATRYNFRIVLDSATGGTATGILVQETLAADPLDARMAGSPSGSPKGDSGDRSRSPESGDERGCAVEVSVEFLDADGNAVAVESLAASDFTVTNGRVGTPVADADGLGWTAPVRAAPGFTGLMRVRLPATERWAAAEQVFRVAGDTDCAPVARNALASLALDGLDLDPAFDAATTAYAASAASDRGMVTVAATAVYGASEVTVAPGDADTDAEGHQVALGEGETEVTVTVTPEEEGVAAKSWTVTVTREAGAGVLTGFVLVDASTDADLGAIADGGTVTVSAAGSYGIRAETQEDAEVGSVVLSLKGPGADDARTRTENIAPYSLYGDDMQGAEHGRALPAGAYTLTATAYAESAGAGAALGTLTVPFTVAHAAPPPPPAGVLTGFTLLDASDQSTMAALADGAKIDLEGRSGGSFAIRADIEANADVGSVGLSLSGAKRASAMESMAPYSLWGDRDDGNGGRALDGSALPAGTYRLLATAYGGARGEGAMLGTLSVSFEVLAPAALSVADAQAEEGPGATLDFAVTLDRESTGTVTVEYATSDGTATAGSDYTETSGTLTFEPGEREKTVSVPVLNDDHDEGSETLTLRLTNAQGASIADGEATGTITNSDAIPKAWLARFGRTVTGQVLEAVEARLTAPRTPGAQATLAGQALPSWTPGSGAGAGPGHDPETGAAPVSETGTGDNAAPEERLSAADSQGRGAMETIRSWMADAGARSSGAPGGDRRPGFRSRALTPRDFLTGTSFALTAKTGAKGDGGGHASLWGRGAISGFDGREGALSLDGEVTTGLIGADWASASGSGSGRWVAGMAIGHSTGTGGYRRGGGCETNCGGRIEASLTGLYPYAGIDLTERLSVWAAAGYGAGEVTVTPEGGPGLTADLSMAMGAAGVRSAVLRPEGGDGLSLDFKGDARFTRTSSDAVRSDGGNLEAADADVWLLRAGVEGSRRFALGGGGSSFTPSFEIALRLDGGDAETGFGADLGGGLAFADPENGLRLDLKGRVLLAHRSAGFREWGASGALAWDPRPETDRGLALTLRQSWGASPAGGMDALLSRETLAGLAANDNGDGRFRASSRLEAEIGYGLPMFDGAFTGTPNIGFGLSGGGARDWRIGWRLTSAIKGDPGFEVSLDATRREPANDEEPEHEVMLRAAIRF